MTTELTGYRSEDLETINNLAMQARTFVQGACLNLLQLGRVLTEAKPLIKYGDWTNWIRENANVSPRTAEQYMQAYREFGLNPQIADLGTTKVLKLLPLQEEERSDLLRNNDVSGMSTRQLDEAIKKQREQIEAEAMEKAKAEAKKETDQFRAQADLEHRLRLEAEAKLQSGNKSDERVKSLEEQLENAREENRTLQSENAELNEIVEEQQRDYDRVHEELLNARSAQARGDADRIPTDRLTLETFSQAVSSFAGACARMPHMGTTFAVMDPAEKQDYEELLRVIEKWARESRRAIEEGTVIIDG